MFPMQENALVCYILIGLWAFLTNLTACVLFIFNFVFLAKAAVCLIFPKYEPVHKQCMSGGMNEARQHKCAYRY